MARMSKSEIGGNTIIYRYPGGDMDIICSSDRSFMPEGFEKSWNNLDAVKLWDHDDQAHEVAPKRKREKGKKSEGEDMERSMRRARANLRRLALANDFRYFVTLTLDPEKIDRYDVKAITKALNTWTDNMVRRHGLRYVLVPERHQDGAIHFHGFMAGSGLKAVDSGHLGPRGERIYNLPQWKYGFTDAVELYGEYSRAVAYCCKYIGKQEGERPMGRWYYSGGRSDGPGEGVCDHGLSGNGCYRRRHHLPDTWHGIVHNSHKMGGINHD